MTGAWAAAAALFAATTPVNPWARDLAAQAPGSRPMVEARYEDAHRSAFVIEGAAYRMVLDLQSVYGQRIRSIAVQGAGAQAEAVAEPGGTLWIEGADGVRYTSASTVDLSRVNIYRRGPYTIETHWLDVRCTSPGGVVAPVCGEIVFYAYPEKVYVTAILHPLAAFKVRQAGITLPMGWRQARAHLPGTLRFASRVGPEIDLLPTACPTGGLTASVADASAPVAGCVWMAPGTAPASWKRGDRHQTGFGILPALTAVAGQQFATVEEHPLAPERWTVQQGLGARYDRTRGCYLVGTRNDGGFQAHFYDHPNQYETAVFRVANDALPRKVYVCHETAAGERGSVECGVLQDARGAVLPITVQISKNFAGENEERFYNPGDPPFSETYYPLHLAPREVRSVTSHHLYQNWGNHPLKQFSSLGAWMDYYHMSTGVTETTCYVPFKFDGLHGVQIADMRPFSQRFWPSQPQHDNVAGHTFLRYLENGAVRDLEYEGTRFRSTGPNWADVSLMMRSEDLKVAARIDTFEFPQTDELRNFVRLRYDVRAPIRLANPSTDFRLVSVRSYVQSLRYQKFTVSGAAGPETIDIALKAPAQVRSLAGAIPWACIHHDERGNNAIIVRSWRARIGGRASAIRPAVAVLGEAGGNTTLMLTLDQRTPLTLQPGDFVECDAILLPYGPRGTDIRWQTPEREARSYGAAAPRVVRAVRGKVLAHFPVRIAADASGVAEFTVSGGAGVNAILVEGLPGYVRPRIERKAGAAWTMVPHSVRGEDGYQTYVDGRRKFGAVFLEDAGVGAPRTYRAHATAPTAR